MRNILLFGFFLCSTSLYCQTLNRTDNIWITVGPGIYSCKSCLGLSYYSSLNWLHIIPISEINRKHYRKSYMKIRVVKNIGSAGEDFYQNFWEFGYLYGISIGKALRMSIVGGLGFVKGLESISNPITGIHVNKEPLFFKPGIPVEIDFDLVPVKYFGLGFSAYANFNSRCTFYGINLNLSLGKIR